MLQSLREAVDRISDPANLDSSVEEIFALVLGCPCGPIPRVDFHQEKLLMAVVGFGGVLSGTCVLRCGAHAALTMAGRMMNDTFSELDITVQDAMGEICNMLAGDWKGRIPELASDCSLSLPAVIIGRDYQIHVREPQLQLHRSYCFDKEPFEVLIVCEGLH